MIENILIPGRHHLLTEFQHQELARILSDEKVTDINGQALEIAERSSLVWAVTSANHCNTRRNPLPSNRREQAIEVFSEDLPAESFSFAINDVGYSERFADFVIKEIEVASRGLFRLMSKNTAVFCSTPTVIDMYQKLGYQILPAELVSLEPENYSHRRPWDLVLAMVKAGEHWRDDPTFKAEVHHASQHMLNKYRLGDVIVEVHNDPLLGDEGDITETRNYEKYRESFEAGAQRKYDLIKPFIHNGRIVDIGCATGAILKLISDDPNLAEADLYGIEASRRLYNISEQHRQDNDFGNENVFFYQRNFMTSELFPANSVNTTTSFALTHEIYSYLGPDSLQAFLQRVYEQTALGGVYINSDVVGPENKGRKVLMKLNNQDGRTESWEEIAANPRVGKDHLETLSTLGRFRRFSRDFRAEEGERFEFKEAPEIGEDMVELALGGACEFMSKKDYTDSWYSEMHERFCFWDFEEYKAAVEAAGFSVTEGSHAYRNDWIVDNRLKGKVALFTQDEQGLKPLDFPVTNMLLVAEKSFKQFTRLE